MEERYHDSEFEQFVKQSADQYRMYPSEKVWDNIHDSLHGRRKWYGFGLALLLITTTIVTWVMLAVPAKQVAGVSTVVKQKNHQLATKNKPAGQVLLAPVKKTTAQNENTLAATKFLQQKNLYIETESITTPAIEIASLSSNNNPIAILRMPEALNNSRSSAITSHLESSNYTEAIALKIPSKPKTLIMIPPVEIVQKSFVFSAETLDKPEPTTDIATNKAIVFNNNNSSPYPMTIESVVNSYIQLKKRDHVSLLAYISPTVSYRKLKENKPFQDAARASTGMLTYSWQADVNNVVEHKPDIGFELGLKAGYPITNNIRLTSGLQFNISKYDIRAFIAPNEIATIALNNGNAASTVSTVTNYRNFGGYSSDWLHNLYISASIPLGAEIMLSKNSKTYFGTSASLQPTFILANRAYLISTDYKNYAEIPSLTRRWNLNTSFEVFAGNTKGNIKWRLGPQVRYQALSSFLDKYPVKEHLYDFGIKLGVMLK